MKLDRGCVHIYTGDGKGKTTAAVGLAVRMLGAGGRVCLIQFLKGSPTSELRVLRRQPGFTLRRYGGRSWVRDRPTAADLRQARRGLSALGRALHEGHQLVIADEICVAARLGMVSVEEVLELLRRRPAGVEVVLTGRGAPAAWRRAADLVTEGRAVRHYFDREVRARKGIEY